MVFAEATRTIRDDRSSGESLLTAGLIAAGAWLAATAGFGAEESTTQPRYLSPAELHAITEASDLLYEIRLSEDLEAMAPSGLAAAAWPTIGVGLEYPFVEATAGGGKHLVSYPFKDGCLNQLDAGVPAFERRDYATAAEAYVIAVETFPACYLAHLNLGDTYWHRGDARAALLRYERAAELNPYAVQPHYFRANALLKLGHRAEAYQAYLHALALRPHRPSIEQVLGSFAGRLGASYDPWRLEPRILLEPVENGMAITVDPASPAWESYGQCRAIWTLEPGFRELDDEQSKSIWNNGTEANCLRAAIQAYANGRAAGAAAEDPTLERLHRVDQDGLLTGLIFYEVAGRISPDLLLLLPNDVRETILAYLERFVLVRK